MEILEVHDLAKCVVSTFCHHKIQIGIYHMHRQLNPDYQYLLRVELRGHNSEPLLHLPGDLSLRRPRHLLCRRGQVTEGRGLHLQASQHNLQPQHL